MKNGGAKSGDEGSGIRVGKAKRAVASRACARAQNLPATARG